MAKAIFQIHFCMLLIVTNVWSATKQSIVNVKRTQNRDDAPEPIAFSFDENGKYWKEKQGDLSKKSVAEDNQIGHGFTLIVLDNLTTGDESPNMIQSKKMARYDYVSRRLLSSDIASTTSASAYLDCWADSNCTSVGVENLNNDGGNYTNRWNESYEDYLNQIEEFIFPRTWTWILIFIHSLVFVIGLVGNTLVCVAVYRNHTMRTVTNYFIVNLAVADFMVILFCLPPTLIWDVTMTWFFGMTMCKIVLYLQKINLVFCRLRVPDNPKFGQPIVNVTVAVGREAIIECVVENLGTYKVAWLRVDTQTILTIQKHVITKNHRISVTHSEHKTWYLHIREVRETDRGWYMCQINTDPMKSQVGYLQVVVSPDIIDYQTSSDLVVQEGSDVSLKCVAKGSPEPSIIWKRENGQPIYSAMNREVSTVEGPLLNINRANRHQMGPYLCIASNGVPPTVSKRIHLTVQFPPVIWIQYQLIGAYDGQEIILECQSEAFPRSINYWTRDKGEIVPKNEKYEPIIKYDSYKVHMRLIIRRIEQNTYGIYKCVSKNSLGETDGTINVYRIPKPAIPKLTNKSYPNELLDNNVLTYQIGSSRRDSLSLEEGFKNTSPPYLKRSLPYRLCPLLLTCIFWLA